MKRTLQAAGLIAWVSLVAACGGGGGGDGGGGNNPPPSTDDVARRAVLTDIGEDLILPALRNLDTSASSLATLVAALAAAPADAGARSAAQQGWRAAMQTVQRAEIFQVGPAARSSEPGGMDLRDQIYAYPLLNLCRIHLAAYASEAVTSASPIDGTGMGALEYLLFDDTSNPNCPPGTGLNAQALRAQHAGRIADRVATVASQLRMRWEPAGGNFLQSFAAAGAGSTVFSTPQMALDALSSAIFYFEQETKDRKVAGPTGIGSTRIPACTATPGCPERFESRFARVSGDHIRANTQAFRDVFTGVSGGMGLNALLVGIGREALAARFVAEIDAALAGEAAVTPDFETAVEAIVARDTCINASANRTGDPQVCRLHGLVDVITDSLRAEIASTLNLRIPTSAAGDND